MATGIRLKPISADTPKPISATAFVRIVLKNCTRKFLTKSNQTKKLREFMACSIAVREFPMKSGFGFADYLLYLNRKTLGAVEAMISCNIFFCLMYQPIQFNINNRKRTLSRVIFGFCRKRQHIFCFKQTPVVFARIGCVELGTCE